MADLHSRRCRRWGCGTGCGGWDTKIRSTAKCGNVFISHRPLSNLERVEVAVGALVVVTVAEHEELRWQGKPRIHRVAVANHVLAVFEAVDVLSDLARDARNVCREVQRLPFGSHVIMARLLGDVVVERATALA